MMWSVIAVHGDIFGFFVYIYFKNGYWLFQPPLFIQNGQNLYVMTGEIDNLSAVVEKEMLCVLKNRHDE